MYVFKNERNFPLIFFVFYFLIFFATLPLINRKNIYFYVVLIIYWMFFAFLYFIVIKRDHSYDFSIYILVLGFSIGILLNSYSNFYLSEDIFRYLFDGFLLKHAINPYLYAPLNPSISSIAKQFPFFSQINNADVSSPYPPLSVIFSYLFVSFFNYNTYFWLFLINLCTVGTGFLIVKILENIGLNKNLVLLWSLNPNVLLEFNYSGHNDVLSILFFVAAIYLITNKRTTNNFFIILASLLFSFSIGFKIFMFIAFPFLTKFLKKSGSFLTIFFTVIQFLLFYFFINLNGSGIIIFLKYWRFNGGLFDLLYFIFNGLSTNPSNLSLELILRTLFTIVFGLCFLIILYSFYKNPEKNDLKDVFLYIGYSYILLFILSPVLHPWYVLWALVPFIFSFEKKFYPYWVLLFLVNSSYLYYLNNSLLNYFMIIEYGFFFISLLTVLVNRNLIGRIKDFFKRLRNSQKV